MSFSHVIDIDRLVSPLTGDAPQGNDIRTDRSPTSDYYTIKDARNAARAAERAALFGEEDSGESYTAWLTVSEVAEKILSQESKDLEVASWYLESLVRMHGIAGLRDGFLVIQKLVTDHWDGLFPEPDEDGIETRVAPLTGLNGDGGEGTLLTPLRNIPITDDGDAGIFSYWQYLQARDADRIEDDDKKEERLSSLGYSLAGFNSTIAGMAVGNCRNYVTTLEECIVIYKELSAKLRELCAGDAPPSSKISELLDELTRTVRFVYKEKIDAADAADAAQAAEEVAASAAAESSDAEQQPVQGGQVIQLSGFRSGPIASREDALKAMESAAKYFRQYEPHTPVAPGLERLIEWGRMTVAELMMELIPDSSARSLFSQFTGVKLDGTDTHSYVAPPVATQQAPAQAQVSSQETRAVPESTPQPEKTSGMGW